MKAKKITPAPRITPLQPYSPKVPVLGGRNGYQLAWSMNSAPAPMTTRTTATLITTMTLLVDADSLTPTIRRAVTATVMITAGTLKTAVTGSAPATWTIVPGAALNAAGKLRPIWWSSVTRFPDQPTATV